MNAASALRGNTLYVYGGLYEVFGTSNELTLNDMWSLELGKLDGWRCVEAGNAPQEADEQSADESSDDDESGSDDESDESADSSDDASDSDASGGEAGA